MDWFALIIGFVIGWVARSLLKVYKKVTKVLQEEQK